VTDGFSPSDWPVSPEGPTPGGGGGGGAIPPKGLAVPKAPGFSCCFFYPLAFPPLILLTHPPIDVLTIWWFGDHGAVLAVELFPVRSFSFSGPSILLHRQIHSLAKEMAG